VTPKDALQLCIELIKALAWPLVTLTGLLVFRTELKALLRRIKGGKFFGQEVSLGEDLDRLESKTTEAETAVPPLALSAGTEPAEEAHARSRDEVLVALASSMPVGALVQLSSRIERQARELLVASGKLSTKRVLSLTPMIAMLRRGNAIPEEVLQSLEQFTEVRNKIVHGQGVPQADVERTVVSGLRLLELLSKLPRGAHVVREVGLALSSDPEGTTPLPGVTGVRVETAQHPGSAPGVLQVLPTRKTFEVGQRVSWEWDLDETFGPAWVRDPATQTWVRAWKESAAFTGQPLASVRDAA
jgi:hypothetical protein